MRRLPVPALLVLLVLAGCPLASDHPLSDPAGARVDPALVGRWTARDADTGESRAITFRPFSDRELAAFTPGDEPGTVDAYRIFSTDVGTERFLNVRELRDDAPGWYLVRYAISGSRLVLSVVDDGLFSDREFASPAELRAFVLQHLANPRLYAAEGEERQDMVWERWKRGSN